MVTGDDIPWAMLMAAVHQARLHMVAEIDVMLGARRNNHQATEDAGPASTDRQQAPRITIPNHRLSGIARSLAWHERRQHPAARIGSLADELRRLHDNYAESAEVELYTFLQDKLGLNGGAGEWERRVFSALNWPRAERERWQLPARLLLAQAAVQIVQVLMRSEEVRQALERQGGSLRWQ